MLSETVFGPSLIWAVIWGGCKTYGGRKTYQRTRSPENSRKFLEASKRASVLLCLGPRHLLENPFSEPLLRTLFYCKSHSRPPSQNPSENPSENPSPEPFPEPSQNLLRTLLRTLCCSTTSLFSTPPWILGRMPFIQWRKLVMGHKKPLLKPTERIVHLKT